jgi:hypothetical protein
MTGLLAVPGTPQRVGSDPKLYLEHSSCRQPHGPSSALQVLDQKSHSQTVYVNCASPGSAIASQLYPAPFPVSTILCSL